LAAHRRADSEALDLIQNKHPRFLDKEIRWLPLRVAKQEIAAAPFQEDDARLVVARCLDFQDWPALEEYVESLEGPAGHFEAAVEAVVDGRAEALSSLLREHPELITSRSRRRTCMDPPVHRATLLHYLAANGVEGRRQRSPANAVEIARILLTAGAGANALYDCYGGSFPILPLLVSSSPPAEAGVQVPLIDILVEFGASVQPAGEGRWTEPLLTALIFGHADAARALLRHGAETNFVTGAGLGEFGGYESATAGQRHQALCLAAQMGHAGVVTQLLARGEDPNRFNPEGFHSHATPLHQAALAGHTEVVRLLLSYGAKSDIKDKLWDGDALGWANHGGQRETARLLGGTLSAVARPQLPPRFDQSGFRFFAGQGQPVEGDIGLPVHNAAPHL